MFNFLKFSSVSSLFLLMYSFVLFPFTVSFFLNQKCMLIEWVIFQMSSCSMSMMFVVDEISLSFSNVVVFISGCVMMFSSSYMAADPFLKRFSVLVLLFVFSMNFLIFIPSLPALLLGWDGLGIVSFALVIYYQNSKSLGAGMITILANRIGDVMILLCIGLLVLQGHWVVLLMWDFHLSYLSIFVLVVAAMTKSAQIPFSSWLPAAMAAPTPVSALVHSSTLVTAGVYLIIRFLPFLLTVSFFKPMLFVISILTMLLAGIGANFENDLKKIIALSTLSQLGVMMMSLGMGMAYLSLFHLYTHAMFKALLFLCAGNIIHNSSDCQDIRYMGSISHQLPVTICCMNIANLSLCGAPFLSGFYSKDMILEFCLLSNSNFIMVLLVFLATGMTAGYSFRLSFCSFWSAMKTYPYHEKTDTDMYVNTSISALSLIAIVSGMFLQVCVENFNPIIFVMPSYMKVLTLVVIILGVFLAGIFWEEGFVKAISKSYFFVSTMWFLGLISAQPLSKMTMMFSENVLKSIDFGWLEILGGQGVKATLGDMTQMNQYMQMKSFNFMVFVMLMSVVIICFLIVT